MINEVKNIKVIGKILIDNKTINNQGEINTIHKNNLNLDYAKNILHNCQQRRGYKIYEKKKF